MRWINLTVSTWRLVEIIADFPLLCYIESSPSYQLAYVDVNKMKVELFCKK